MTDHLGDDVAEHPELAFDPQRYQLATYRAPTGTWVIVVTELPTIDVGEGN